jgi:site-specific recombinase XerD
MSALRERFIRDLRIENYSDRTIKSYVGEIILLARYYHKCPTEISEEEIKEYIAMRQSEGKSWSSINLFISALHKLFNTTLNDPRRLERINRPKIEKKIPSILSQEEVLAILESTANLKHKTFLMTIYSAGLRVGEACDLRVGDIDSARMRIIVRSGKGHKDREVALSEVLLTSLRAYFKSYRPLIFLFPGRDKSKPYSQSSARAVLKKALKRSGITKKATPHTLRHSYATHMMDKGVDIRFIQALLGHKSLKTTLHYCHLSKQGMQAITSPLDDLKLT